MGHRVGVEGVVTSSTARALMAQAALLEDGRKAKTELLEEAVRLADSDNDDDLAYDARMKLLPAANWSGDVDKMLIAFAWCVAKYESAPERDVFRAYQILWYSKWAALEAPRFPSVAKPRIAQLLDDTERRFRDHGVSLRPVYQHRHYAAVELGDLDTAAVCYDKWWSEPRDRYADCAACEESARLDWALTRGDDSGALEIAQDIYRRGMRCAEVPHRIYGQTLVPLLRAGRVDEAKSAYRSGIRMIAKIEHNMAADVAKHAVFLALTGNFTSAQRVWSRVLARAAEHRLPSTRALVFADTALLCDLFVASGRARAKLPAIAPLPMPVDARGRVDVAALGASAWSEAVRIGALYDKRNGNGSFSAGLKAKRKLVELAVDAPLTTKRAALDVDDD